MLDNYKDIVHLFSKLWHQLKPATNYFYVKTVWGDRMIGEFAGLLRDLLAAIVDGVGSSVSGWDQKSYESVVNCLLLKDEIAVKEAVDHLILEGKALAIPPIYLASQRHSSLTVRRYCQQSLSRLDSSDRIHKTIQGKDIHGALDALIEEYGHFKDDYH